MCVSQYGAALNKNQNLLCLKYLEKKKKHESTFWYVQSMQSFLGATMTLQNLSTLSPFTPTPTICSALRLLSEFLKLCSL